MIVRTTFGCLHRSARKPIAGAGKKRYVMLFLVISSLPNEAMTMNCGGTTFPGLGDNA